MYLYEFNVAQLAALGALTVAATSAVALAAIWTAWGARYRWYVRALSLVALIGPLDWTPGFSFWLTFVVQALAMVLVLGLLRIAAAPNVGDRSLRITDILAALIYLSLVLTPVGIRIDWLPAFGPGALVTGCGFSLLGLLGYWLATPTRGRKDRMARIVALVVATPVLAKVVIDLAPPFLPPHASFIDCWELALAVAWAVPFVIAATASPWLRDRAARESAHHLQAGSWRRWLAGLTGGALAGTLIIGYAIVLDDPGSGQAPLPSPNGYDVISEALTQFNHDLSTTPSLASDAELADYLARSSSLRSRAAHALEMPFVVRLDAPESHLRSRLVNAWDGEMVAHARRGDAAGMVSPISSLLKLCRRETHGGTTLHAYLCHSSMWRLVPEIRQTIPWPDAPELQPLLPVLLDWDRGLESAADIDARSQTHARYFQVKHRIREALRGLGNYQESSIGLFTTVRADARLLALELALARYRALHGDYPDSLEQLVPEILSAVPADPFVPLRPISYRRQPTGYLLYCVGFDGVDNGGVQQATPGRGDYLLR